MSSNFIVYVDESGDHGLTSINPSYPVFVLAFCIFPVDAYVDRIVPLVQRIKFDFFNHDMVILHEREIRKSEPPFDILLRSDVRADFMKRIDALFDEQFSVVATAIRKHEFKERVGQSLNPYNVALEYGLERVFLHLRALGGAESETVVVFESRGRREDTELAEEFERVMSTTALRQMPGRLCFRIASKQANSAGLQIADLVARPIGAHLLRPDQPNRAWTRIEQRMPRGATSSVLGWGLKIYP